MKVWEFESCVEVFTLRCHIDYIRGLTCTHDGKYVITGGDDGIAKIWGFEGKLPDRSLGLHDNIVSCLCVNENLLVSGSDDKKVIIWDLNTGK
jgi:WD40 repeat protein